MAMHKENENTVHLIHFTRDELKTLEQILLDDLEDDLEQAGFDHPDLASVPIMKHYYDRATAFSKIKDSL
jgi:hypothetical protein|tara:strand:- start:731 stop:940 length:210 start_codon:yes stop_codon:yes gene_type:complete